MAEEAVNELTVAEEAMNEPTQSTTLVIKEYDFQEAKKDLEKYTKIKKDDIEFTTVANTSFGVFSHKVTGEELNETIGEIQNYLIRFNDLCNNFIDEFGTVYKLFESLDKDYISAIVMAIKAAEKVSKKEQEDRRAIKELVKQHTQAIEVLGKFKEEIEMLKHINDVDQLWQKSESISSDIERLNKSLDKQNETLQSIIKTQTETQLLIEEKNTICNKIKYAYIVASGAVVCTIIQLCLSILGVI